MPTSLSTLQSGIKTDALVLLAKIYYASGLYEEALEELNKSGFEVIDQVASTVRNLQLMAEAYAIKAFSLEKVRSSIIIKYFSVMTSCPSLLTVGSYYVLRAVGRPIMARNSRNDRS